MHLQLHNMLKYSLGKINERRGGRIRPMQTVKSFIEGKKEWEP